MKSGISRELKNTGARTPEDTEESDVEKVVTDQINGFITNRDFSLSSGLNTVVYGMFNFGRESYIQAVRHVVSPSVSYSYRPDFSTDFWGFYDKYYEPMVKDPLKAIQVRMARRYSKFENSVYGGPSSGLQSSLSFSLGNSLEAKIRAKKDTVIASKKIPILQSLNVSTSYNMAAEEFKWSDVSLSGSTMLLGKVNLNFRSTYSPYALNANNQRVDKLLIEQGGFLRMTNAGFGFSVPLSSAIFTTKPKKSSKPKSNLNNKKN